MQNGKEFLLSNETRNAHLYTYERINIWATIIEEVYGWIRHYSSQYMTHIPFLSVYPLAKMIADSNCERSSGKTKVYAIPRLN